MSRPDPTPQVGRSRTVGRGAAARGPRPAAAATHADRPMPAAPVSALTAAHLAGIIETQAAIAAADMTPDALFETVCERAARLTNASGATVEIAEGASMVYRGVSGSLSPFLGFRVPIDGSLSGRSVRSGAILRCDDSETDDRVDRAACRRVGARSLVVVPLVHGGRTIGVLKVIAATVAAFDDTDVAMLQLVTGLIAASLAHLADFEERERLAKREATRSDRLIRLNAFSELVGSVLDPDELAQRIVEQVGAVLPVDVVALTLRDPGSDAFTVRAAVGVSDVVGKEVRIGEGMAGTALATGRIHLRTDVRRDEYPQAVRQFPATDALAVGAAVPIIRDVEAIGAVTLFRIHGPAFDHEEQEVLGLLAAQLSVALGNSQAYRRLGELADVDALTGLANRRTWDVRSRELTGPGSRQETAALVFFDLDHFGRVNNEHGHAVGDEALRQFAAVLRGAFRGSDLVARYGGEEFVALLPGATVDVAVRLAERVRARLREVAISTPSGAITLTVSAGCAAVHSGTGAIGTALAAADDALLRAKRAGRDRVEVG